MRFIPDFDLKSLADPKSWFRLQAKTLRKELQAKRPDAGRHAAANFMKALAPKPNTTVAVYFPTGSELDTWPLVEALFAGNIPVCLPVVIAKNMPLTFRDYTPETALHKGAFGIPVPPDTAPEILPDIVVCPLLAFRRDGTRLGMGGGYYDRTLNTLRQSHKIVSVGYAFAGQEASQIPSERHDEKLDWIITEREVLRLLPDRFSQR